MKFAEADTDGGHRILGYGPGRIVVDGRSYVDSLIVSPDRIIAAWGPSTAADLRAVHFETLTALNPQVIVIGTGERQVFPDPHLYFALLERGLGVEIMDTGAACRTYNILMSEGRRVAAGLIMC
jgi:uncharacterized protein